MSDRRSGKKKTDKATLGAAQTKKEPAFLFQLIVTVAILSIYGYFLAYPVDLTNGDFGRHLKNGELFIHSGVIPRTNLYSYTYPDHPFVNHHWGSGVLFYLIERASGFYGLSLAFVAISLFTLLIFLNLAAKHSSFELAALMALCVIPILITRRVLRPELFSYLLSGVFLHLLWGYKYHHIDFRWLLSLPLLMVFWVNLHIYFFVGVMLIALVCFEFLIQLVVAKNRDSAIQFKRLASVALLTLLATGLNPSGVYGAIYPFLIFREYEFPVMENYSVRALLGTGYEFLPVIYFQIVFGLLCLSWFYAFLKDRPRISIGNLLLTAIFSAMAWWAVRNFALFGFLALPLAAANLKNLRGLKKSRDSRGAMLKSSGALLLTAIILVLINPVYFFGSGRGPVEFGLKEANSAAAEFFLSENLRGPIFNNYDVGGYLIRHLYPNHKVFADNRPEAYPAAFFRDVYFPLQMSEKKWADISSEFGFAVIVFNHRDRSSWSEQFVVRRVRDPAWAPVFLDKDIIILVKRYGPNHATIAKFEIAEENILQRSN